MNATSAEVRDRVASLLAPSGNGHAATGGDDLDWVLFRSFPDGAVDAPTFAELVPIYAAALADGVAFDHELLFVRVVEMGASIPDADRRAVADAAAQRLSSPDFDPDETPAVVRFLVRVPPTSADALTSLLKSPVHERLQFFLTTDFVLDERDLDDYLALSYLRDSDPDSPVALSRFPVPGDAREQLVRFFSEEETVPRIQAGWRRWPTEAERPTLRRGFAVRLPRLVLESEA